jgi:ketosteroid isomerase-like protein
MTKPITKLACLIALLIVPAINIAKDSGASDSNEIKEKIIALEKGALERWNKGDPLGYLEIYAEDITYFDEETKTRLDGYTAMKELLEPIKGKIHKASFEMTTPKVQLRGDVGILTFNLITRSNKDKVISRWNSTEVYSKINGVWKIIHSHWSFTKPKKEEKKMARENSPTSFQPKSLDDDWSKWLVGEWEGPVESDVGTCKLWIKIDFGLNGQFLIIKSENEIIELTAEQIKYLKDILRASDEDIERYRSSTFKELQIHTIDPKTGEVVGYLFDSMRCIAEGRGRRQGNKEIIEWKWSGNAQGATSVGIIEKINDNKFTLNHKYTLPNGNKMEDKAEMTRVKVTTEK